MDGSYNGQSIYKSINGWFRGTPISGNLHMVISLLGSWNWWSLKNHWKYRLTHQKKCESLNIIRQNWEANILYALVWISVIIINIPSSNLFNSYWKFLIKKWWIFPLALSHRNQGQYQPHSSDTWPRSQGSSQYPSPHATSNPSNKSEVWLIGFPSPNYDSIYV